MSNEPKIIAVCNQKGGVGKTTTAVNLAASFVHRNKKVMLVDLDPQGNATMGSGVDKNHFAHGTLDVLLGEKNIKEARLYSQAGRYDVLASNRDLTGVDIRLMDMPARELCLKNALTDVLTDYDYILLDCPPTLSLLMLNALAAANSVLIPMQCEYYALEGVSDLLATVRRVRQTINSGLNIEGVVFTMFDTRTRLSLEVSDQLRNYFGQQVLSTTIPRNVVLAEAPSHGLPALVYDARAKGSEAYLKLADELLTRGNVSRSHGVAGALRSFPQSTI